MNKIQINWTYGGGFMGNLARTRPNFPASGQMKI